MEPKTPATNRQEVGWLFLSPKVVPERWRDRAIPCVLVPLLPDEADHLLAGTEMVPEIDRDDESLAHLVARGLPAEEIATELGFTRRTVDRRIARLRKTLGTRTTSELAAALAARGF